MPDINFIVSESNDFIYDMCINERLKYFEVSTMDFHNIICIAP